MAREREAPARTDESVRVDPICDVEFEGGMYRVVQLLDKVGGWVGVSRSCCVVGRGGMAVGGSCIPHPADSCCIPHPAEPNHAQQQVPLSAEQTADGKWVLVSDASTHVQLDAAAAGQK